MAKKKAYDNDSISSLKGADRVRKRPGVIFGSDGLEGCEHAVFEILSNAIDEARAGFGRVITVTRFQDRSIQVEDQGRGCPVDWNEKEGRYNWELVFCEMYAGGKYDPTGENYEFSLGLNGLGSCATQYASRYMDVTVCRDGNEYKLHFQRGEIVGQMEVTPLARKKTGTTIRWLPDLEVFTDIDIPLDYYQDVMKRQAVVNAGVTFRLRDEVSPGRFETQDFLYENGIRDYLAELAGDDPITRPVCWEAERQGRDRADKPEYKVKLNIAWCFSNRVHLMEHYHNSSFLEHGGSPDKATRLAFVAALDKYLRENNKYTKGESKITFPDVQECLLLVSSNFSTQTSYENQTKKAITNKFIQDAMSEFLRQQLQVFFIENHDDAERMAAQVLINKRSRETAERTRLGAKKKLSEKIDIANRVQKFVDCRTKSDVITDLMKVLGCGVEVQGKAAKELSQFDLNNLRWSKVVICTDGDVDGFQIRTLILTMLYRLCPTLIREGYVYIAETPLFEITYREKNADKTWFAYSEKEKADIVRQLEGKKFTVQRSKGLGENDPEMMWLTTMNPETRRLVRVLPDEAEETARVFDLLLGDNLAGRKDYIAENGHLYLDMIDVS